MKFTRNQGVVLFAAIVLVLVPACGGGSGGSSDTGKAANELVLVDVSVAGFDGVALNEIIKFEFSEVLDPDTVRADTINIREGPNYGKQVPGFFRVDGNEVLFFPRLPTLPDLSDSGMQPGKTYRVTLPGTPTVATVRSFANDRLKKDKVETFATAVAGSKNLFVDNFLDPLPPKVIFANPADGAIGVPAASEITLTMNRRPLHPGTVTESNVKLTMISRQGKAVTRPIPGSPVLTQSHDSVTINFRSTFPLADEATYALHLDRRVSDLVGNDVVEFDSTFTIRDEPIRSTALELQFDAASVDSQRDLANTTASWDEAVAGGLSALFTAAGGNGTAGDLSPGADIVLSPDDFVRGVQVITEHGIEYDAYNFRSVTIPQDVKVRFMQRAAGPNRPIKIISLKNIEIEGTLTVSGGIGEPGEGSNNTTSKIPEAKGGEAGPGGGDGRENDQTAETDKPEIMSAEDVLYGGGGGEGGGMGTYKYSYYASTTYYYKYAYSYVGGGGGGGGNRTRGTAGKDGNYPTAQYRGEGGKGGLSNDDRGNPPNLERAPNVGGAGGGAGGKGFYKYERLLGSNTTGTLYLGGSGAGGAGGGGLAVQSAGNVTIKGAGKIESDGGDGGRGMLNWQYSGGAGGAGAGGSVKVIATNRVILEAGATISVKGGQGGAKGGSTYTYYNPGPGGPGGDGYIRFEALEDENSPGTPLVEGVAGANMTYGPPSLGTFAPMGGGAPSIGQTVWLNLGVYDPIMVKPTVTDVVATLFNDTMKIEVQMSGEDPANLGNPNLNAQDLADQDGDGMTDDTLDPSTLSEWIPIQEIESLNNKAFQFIRVRITFQLDDGQTFDQPLPFMDYMRIVFKF